MKHDWTIRLEQTAVPGWPGTFRDWFVVVNPHGGRMAFLTTCDSAKVGLVKARAEWRCDCSDCELTP